MVSSGGINRQETNVSPKIFFKKFSLEKKIKKQLTCMVDRNKIFIKRYFNWGQELDIFYNGTAKKLNILCKKLIFDTKI